MKMPMGMSLSPSAGNSDPLIEARYWRVWITSTQSGGGSPSAVSCAELEMRSAAGGGDITTGGTPSASTILSGSYPASAAFDGDGATFWVSSNTAIDYATHWIKYDFGTPVSVREIAWAKRPDSFRANEALIFGTVQYSYDNLTWVSLWAFITPPTWPTGAETRVFTKPNGPLKKQFWRVRVTALQGGSAATPSFADVQFRGTAGGPDEASGGQGIASRTTGYAAITQAFDGSDATIWAATDTVASQPWIGYAFTSQIAVVEVALRNRNDGFGADQGITAGDVQSSFDGITWATEWSFTSPATWLNSSPETRVFTRP